MIRGRLDAWRARASPRERTLAASGATLVVAALAWALVVDPLARDIAVTEGALAQARGTLAQVRTQARALDTTAPLQPSLDARAALERTLDRLALRPALTAVQARDGRVEATFEAIDFAALTALVAALARDVQLFPVEALVVPRTAPGSVRAEIAFARASP